MPTPPSLSDARFALRYFARHKATTAIIIAVLALGTGANAMIFSMFQAYFVRPAPAVPDNAAHARIWAQERPTRAARWKQRGFTQQELSGLAERREVFRNVAAWTEDEIVLDAGDSTGARGVNAQFVTPNYFATLGIPLAAGQGFARGAADAPELTAVMSYKMAERLYGNATAAIGKQVIVNEVAVHVVGVAPEHFQGAVRNMDEPALWMPTSARADVAHVSPRWASEDAALALFATMAPDASREQATALARQIVAHALPDSATRIGMARTADVLAIGALPPGDDSNEMLLALTMIIGVGVLMLLVAWMNVSSLMVAAAVGRRHEIAVRLSLGASRMRLLRQLVTESTLLALAGSAVGLTLAWWALLYSASTEVDGVNLIPDVVTFAFVLGMAVVTGIVFGLSPALHAIGGGVATAIRDANTGTQQRSRLQRGFVVAQIALSQPLLVVLGVMLSIVIAGYQPMAVTTSSRVIAVDLRPLTTGGTPNQRPDAVDSLVPRLAAHSQVAAAALDASGFDVRGLIVSDRKVPNAAADSISTIVHLEGAAPGWFALMDVPIVLGRDVALADTTAAERPVVIGSDLAHALWGDANPIGRTLASPALPGMTQDSIAMTVVGVYDATARSPKMTFDGATAAGTVMPRIYTAHGKHWLHDRVLVRTRGPAAPYVPELQRVVRAEAPAMPVRAMMTLQQEDERANSEKFRVALAAGAGGLLALLLASLGLYGVVSLAVRQRTREIGIRIAIGARPVEVARTFLRSGVRVSFVALALGLPLSMVALKVAIAQGLLLTTVVSPLAIGLVIAPLLVAVAAAAAWLPARRAAAIDPARTLRVE